MVVSLVLEHQEPALGLAIDIDVDENAAGVVLLTHLHVIQLPGFPEIFGTYRGHIHQVQSFAFAAKLRAHFEV